jgi:hypothetical protein
MRSAAGAGASQIRLSENPVIARDLRLSKTQKSIISFCMSTTSFIPFSLSKNQFLITNKKRGVK